MLIARRSLHVLGGYHSVASTSHLDSLLLCKASGAGLRQLVLTRPCAMLHQKHPARDPSGVEARAPPASCSPEARAARNLSDGSNGATGSSDSACWDRCQTGVWTGGRAARCAGGASCCRAGSSPTSAAARRAPPYPPPPPFPSY